jgi:hypothetical protein
MGRARKPGPMDRSMRVNILLEKSTALVYIRGTMDHDTMANGSRTKSVGSALTHGSTGASIKVNGSTITWKAWEYIPGKMGGDTRGNIATIRSTGTASIHGPIIECIKVCGSAENSTVSVSTLFPDPNLNTVYGKMANESNGLIRTAHRLFSMAS